MQETYKNVVDKHIAFLMLSHGIFEKKTYDDKYDIRDKN